MCQGTRLLREVYQHSGLSINLYLFLKPGVDRREQQIKHPFYFRRFGNGNFHFKSKTFQWKILSTNLIVPIKTVDM